MFTSPSQILCTIFGVNIYYYGIVLAIAISVGTLFSDWFGTKFFEIKKDTIIDMAPYYIIFGILGARIYYCLLNYDFYLRFPTEIVAIRHGGISIHGAMIGGALGIWLFSIRHKVSLLKLLDVSALGLALAQSIGRWGNFFNSEAFGRPTALPWKLYIAPQYRPIPYQDCEFFHPTFLYESILDLVIFGLLLLFFKKAKFRKDGDFALVYLILYSFVRIFVESIRIDSVRYIMGLPVAIFVSIGIIIVSTIVLIKRRSYEDEDK